MTRTTLAKRLAALEKTVSELKAQIASTPSANRRWWVQDAGRFANDPIFDEMVRLGREYRESLRPGRGKKKA
jgi:hypothetical protein